MEVRTIGEIHMKIHQEIAMIEYFSEEVASKKALRGLHQQELSRLLNELTEVARQEGADIYRHKQSILDALNKPKRKRGRPAKVA